MRVRLDRHGQQLQLVLHQLLFGDLSDGHLPDPRELCVHHVPGVPFLGRDQRPHRRLSGRPHPHPLGPLPAVDLFRYRAALHHDGAALLAAPRLGAPDQDGLRLRPLRAGGALLHDGQPDLRLPQRGRHAGPGGARVAGLLPAALCLHRLHGDDPAGRARGARPLQQKPRHGLLLPGRHLCRLLHPHADLRREGAEGGHPALQHGRQDVHLQAAAALL